MTRAAWADRPDIRTRWCTCPRDTEGEIERGYIEATQDGETTRTWYRLTDPRCPLHGDNLKAAPF